MERKTPLYACHQQAQGRIVPFAGYLLPVQYPTGVIREHLAVREACGLFDVSHMGEVLYRGKDALENLQHLLTNDFSTMPIGKVRYSLMLNEQGGAVDDLIVYRLGEEAFWVVVNAANREKDVAWMQQHRFGACEVTDMSDEVAQLALQGPKAEAILRGFTPALPQGYYTFLPRVTVAGVECLISRTGYTGEDGFELYCANADAPALWNALLEAGAPMGLIPCGLGARDTLRLEAAMPLYGHELSASITPYEAKLRWAVKPAKADFIGKAALEAAGEPSRKRVGLRVTGRGIAREGCEVYANGARVGMVTSGTHLPKLGYAAAMALVDVNACATGDSVEIDVRGRRIAAEVVALPFYQREKQA